METLVRNQSKGLLLFVFVYTLIRMFLSLPVTAIQDKGTLAIALAALAISWAVIAFVLDERKGLFVAINLIVTALFVYFVFQAFELKEVKYAILVVVVFAGVIAITDLILVARSDKKVGVWLLVGIAILLIVLFGIEYLISVLNPA